MSGWKFDASHLVSADGLQCDRCGVVSREFSATVRCLFSPSGATEPEKEPAYGSADAPLAERDPDAAFDEAWGSCPELAGSKFSDRVYHALKSRAETAEASLHAVEATVAGIVEQMRNWDRSSVSAMNQLRGLEMTVEEWADALASVIRPNG